MRRIHLSSRNFIFRIRNSCDNEFIAKGTLRNHKLRHTGEKPLSGNELASQLLKRSCKEEPQKPQAPSHRRKAYFRTLTCNICDNRSFRKRALKNHMLGHTGEKPSILKSLQGLWLINFITYNPEEPDTEPYWGKATFWMRICKSCEKDFISWEVFF